MNIAEARAFAQACREYSNGVPDPFSQKAFKKTADIIGALLAELSSAGVINNDGVINRKVINISVVNKEKGKGKENFPPAPPIEKREIQEKAAAAAARAGAHACEGKVDGGGFAGPKWDEVLRYVKRTKVDTAYARWWYSQMAALGWCDTEDDTKPMGNWKALLRVWWLKRTKHGDDWKPSVEAKPRRYSRAEWQLCAERCAHFDAQRGDCGCGCPVPPQLRTPARPPEECENVKAKSEK